ncbi:MAG: hypothetical protein ACRC9R_01915 [Enterovibrio sp.]
MYNALFFFKKIKKEQYMDAPIAKLLTLPESGARRFEQAHALWNTLSAFVLFNRGKTITYGELAKLLEYPAQAGRTLQDALGCVSLYCIYNDLPPLSCIVVNKGTRTPGWEGMIPEDKTLEEVQTEVWDTKWNLYRTPTIGVFKRVLEELSWDDYI